MMPAMAEGASPATSRPITPPQLPARRADRPTDRVTQRRGHDLDADLASLRRRHRHGPHFQRLLRLPRHCRFALDGLARRVCHRDYRRGRTGARRCGQRRGTRGAAARCGRQPGGETVLLAAGRCCCDVVVRVRRNLQHPCRDDDGMRGAGALALIVLLPLASCVDGGGRLCYRHRQHTNNWPCMCE